MDLREPCLDEGIIKLNAMQMKGEFCEYLLFSAEFFMET